METEGRQFPNRLRKHRKMVGLTQREVAQLIGVHDVQISYWERGKFLPSTLSLLKLCILYRAMPQDFYGDLMLHLKSELSKMQESSFLDNEV